MRKSWLFMAMIAGVLGFGPRPRRTRRTSSASRCRCWPIPFWERYVDFVKQVAQQLDVKVNVVDCQNQEAKQLQDIENLIASGAKELIVTPQTAQVGPTIIAKARASGHSHRDHRSVARR